MQLKLVAVLFALAQVAPLVQAAPVESAPGGHGGHDDFKCVSDTSFMRGGYEIQCAPGTYCEDVGAEGGSPCVSDASGGGESCPLDVDTPGTDTTALGPDVQPTFTGLGDANVTGAEPTAAVTGPASDATATAGGPAETDVGATMTDAAPGGPSATDVEPTAPTGAVSDATATADGPAATSDGPAIEPSGSSITGAASMDPTGSDLAVTGPTETGAAPAETTADGAPTVAAAFMRDRPKNGDWNAPAVPTADQVVPTTTATVPGAPDTAVVPAPVTSAALPVNQTAVIAVDSAVVPTAAAPAPGVFETTEHEAPFVTFQTAGGSTLGSCGTPLGTMHAALSHTLYDSYGGVANGNGNGSPICLNKKTITVTYKGHSVSGIPVLDRCEGCSGYDVDLSQPAFEAVFQALPNPAGVGRVPHRDDPDALGHATWKWD